MKAPPFLLTSEEATRKKKVIRFEIRDPRPKEGNHLYL